MSVACIRSCSRSPLELERRGESAARDGEPLTSDCQISMNALRTGAPFAANRRPVFASVSTWLASPLGLAAASAGVVDCLDCRHCARSRAPAADDDDVVAPCAPKSSA